MCLETTYISQNPTKLCSNSNRALEMGTCALESIPKISLVFHHHSRPAHTSLSPALPQSLPRISRSVRCCTANCFVCTQIIPTTRPLVESLVWTTWSRIQGLVSRPPPVHCMRPCFGGKTGEGEITLKYRNAWSAGGQRWL